MKPLVRFLSSLELAIATLALSMALIVFGTLDQVNLGIYAATQKYFYSLFVYQRIESLDLWIPYLPGGYLLGSVLFVNLVFALFTRHRFTVRKAGAIAIHIGVILLLVGEFVSSVFQKDARMTIDEGASAQFTESFHKAELAIVDATDPDKDRVYAIPQKMLKRRNQIDVEELPFTVSLDDYMSNSVLRSRDEMPPASIRLASKGFGLQVYALPAPETGKMDEQNVPAVFATLFDSRARGSEPVVLGTWLVREFMPGQEFEYEGRSYRLEMRRSREYLPFTVELKDFSHDKYLGTNIPENFSSDVVVHNPETGESRPFHIYMNNPLRYGGLTFYQASFANNDTTTIFQVVRNPGASLPYISCSLVALGMLYQFGLSLSKFVGRRRKAA